MRGHESLMQARIRGIKPALGVLVMVDQRDPCGASVYQPHSDDGAHLVWVKPIDTHPDLRCVVGLKVVVWCPHEGDVAAVQRVCRQCIEAGALRVLGLETSGGSDAPQRIVFGGEHAQLDS